MLLSNPIVDQCSISRGQVGIKYSTAGWHDGGGWLLFDWHHTVWRLWCDWVSPVTRWSDPWHHVLTSSKLYKVAAALPTGHTTGRFNQNILKQSDKRFAGRPSERLRCDMWGFLLRAGGSHCHWHWWSIVSWLGVVSLECQNANRNFMLSWQLTKSWNQTILSYIRTLITPEHVHKLGNSISATIYFRPMSPDQWRICGWNRKAEAGNFQQNRILCVSNQAKGSWFKVQSLRCLGQGLLLSGLIWASLLQVQTQAWQWSEANFRLEDWPIGATIHSLWYGEFL